MRSIYFICLCAYTVVNLGCNNTSFEGGAKKKSTQNSGSSEEGPESESPKVSAANAVPVEAENISIDCTTNSILDEGASMDTQTIEPNINLFINKKCTTQISNNYADAGGLNAEEETRTAVCNMMGYAKASPTEFVSWKFSSPHNNYVIYWEPSTQEMIKKYDARTSVKGKPGNNMFISTKCIGKLRTECPVKGVENLKCK